MAHFYYRYNICKQCGRYDEIHLGMSENGWQFLFQGYYGDQWKPQLEEIKSWDNWAEFMAKHPGRIFNEFNNHISLETFLTSISYSKGQKARKYILDHPKETFQDNKGYWFTFSEWDKK